MVKTAYGTEKRGQPQHINLCDFLWGAAAVTFETSNVETFPDTKKDFKGKKDNFRDRGRKRGNNTQPERGDKGENPNSSM